MKCWQFNTSLSYNFPSIKGEARLREQCLHLFCSHKKSFFPSFYAFPIPLNSKFHQLWKRWSPAGFWWVGHSVKDNERFLGYACTNIWYLNHIQLSTCKGKVWNKFLSTLSIVVTITSRVTGIKSCFEHMYCMSRLVNMKLCSPVWWLAQWDYFLTCSYSPDGRTWIWILL